MRVKIYLVCTIFLLVGCSEGITTDEAYGVGYDSGIADACGKHGVRNSPAPSAYDDSLDEGRLSSAFQDGYWKARNDPNICRR